MHDSVWLASVAKDKEATVARKKHDVGCDGYKWIGFVFSCFLPVAVGVAIAAAAMVAAMAAMVAAMAAAMPWPWRRRRWRRQRWW